MKRLKSHLQKKFLKDRDYIFSETTKKKAVEVYRDLESFFQEDDIDVYGAYNLFKIGAILFHHDPSHPKWKEWCSYSAFTFWEIGEHSYALQYAIIAEEWSFIKEKNWSSVKLSFADKVFIKLLHNPKLEITFYNNLHENWELYLVGILEKEKEYVIDGLSNLKKMDPEEGHYEMLWPFNSMLLAAAAVAKKCGIPLDSMEESLRAYFFAGLADVPSPSKFQHFLKLTAKHI